MQVRPLHPHHTFLLTQHARAIERTGDILGRLVATDEFDAATVRNLLELIKDEIGELEMHLAALRANAVLRAVIQTGIKKGAAPEGTVPE